MIKIGIIMDPIATIKPHKDTSFALLLAAQQRGYQIYYIPFDSLALHNNEVQGSIYPAQVQDQDDSWYHLEAPADKPLATLDAIFMRKDPPFNQEYIYATYLLELVEAQGTLVINKPQSLRDANEKLFTAWFPQFTPPTLVTRRTDLIRKFIEDKQDVILKPLDGMGGASIFRVTATDPNRSVIIETLTQHGQTSIMAQTYLPAIQAGDKRILIINGQVASHVLARIPAQGETRGNLAAGGHGVVQPLQDEDRQIATAIAPELIKRGLYFVGLDVIGNKVTEINVTSPTCLREIEAETGLCLTNDLFDFIEQSCSNKSVIVKQ